MGFTESVSVTRQLIPRNLNVDQCDDSDLKCQVNGHKMISCEHSSFKFGLSIFWLYFT